MYFKNHVTPQTFMVLSMVTVKSVAYLQVKCFWREKLYSAYTQHLTKSGFSYKIVISTATEIKKFPCRKPKGNSIVIKLGYVSHLLCNAVYFTHT